MQYQHQQRDEKTLCELWQQGLLAVPSVDYVHTDYIKTEREPMMNMVERELYEVNPDDHEWRKPFFAHLPTYLTKYFAKRYINTFKSQGRAKANTFLRDKMTGELNRRVQLVLAQYHNLPTSHKAMHVYEELDFDDLPVQKVELENIKKNETTNIGKLLCEMEIDEIKEVAFVISLRMHKEFQMLTEHINCKTEREADIAMIEVYSKVAELAASFGVNPPRKYKNQTAESATTDLSKMLAESWWLNKLKRARLRMREHLAIATGQVSNAASAYCSWDCINEYKSQQAKNWSFIQQMSLRDEDTGETADLSELVLKSTANPAIRRHELMTRMRGCEDVAQQLELKGLFLTLTAPAKYHSSYKAGGFIGHWDGFSPSDTQKYLSNTWAKIRAKLARDNIRWFGVRVAEPHHDGTPHWHLLLWVKPEHQEAVTNIFIKYACQEDKHELMKSGAFDHKARCDVKEIDPEKGSATGYIAKYISKNIDGFALDDEDSDESGKPIKDMAKNVSAWASRWNIRQFQFFGGAPVTTYRELRRFANIDKARFSEYLFELDYKSLLAMYRDYEKELVGTPMPKRLLTKTELMHRLSSSYLPEFKDSNSGIEKTMRAADAGDWANYLLGQGGVFVKRDELLIRNWYEEIPYGTEHGEHVKKIKGISAAGLDIKTRLKEWSIVPTKSVEQAASALGSSALSVASGDAWSSVNNCTQEVKRQLDRLLGFDNYDEELLVGLLGQGRWIRAGDMSFKVKRGFIDERGQRRPAQLIVKECL